MARPYSLRKSRNILKWVYGWYKKHSQKLSPAQLTTIESDMASLDQALLQQQQPEANDRARHLEMFANQNCKKTIFDYTKELFFALIFALVIASIVRSMWFEPYEIPTGSMRPTFKEQDHLTVTKTAFGLNVPFKTDHFYFDPGLVQRSSILIFSGDGLPLRDTDTTYFGIPYKKRYIKRAIGKPGDVFYFYGGQLYAIDKAGNDLKELREAPWMLPLEHIPFLSFEGEITASGNNKILFNHFHRPFGRLAIGAGGQITSDIFNGKEWIKDKPIAQKSAHNEIETYSDFLGIRNYAEARLLTKEQLKQISDDPDNLEEGVLYLQLHHTPSLSYPKPLVQRDGAGVSIGIPAYSTIIPLQQAQLDAIMGHMYTARFVVSEEKARRYSLEKEHTTPASPVFSGVPDGTYEFYYGKASKIGWGGIESAVPSDSALYSHEPKNIQKLFNLGIEMNTAFNPSAKNQTLFPHRYVYFRNGDLYTMGGLILKKDDPILVKFRESEENKELHSTAKAPYIAFKDYGAPMKDGKIDVEFIKTFGIAIPEKTYMMLGDNHAMSADSRIFGFVPEANLQGAPSTIVWPWGDRLGSPPQKPYPFMNIPRAIVWTIAALIAAIYYAYYLWRIRQPIFIKKVPK
ncbi:MAG: signal peptidase I [Parachlamydiaceae bacterium]|nr:signal peptidase I [Parachlamydiaceae bacterium]